MTIDSVILHDIRSSQNVGAILRTCDGFGVKKVYIGGITPYPRIQGDNRLPHIIDKLSRDISKTALGAENTVDIIHYDEIASCLKSMQADGIDIVALEQTPQARGITGFSGTSPVSVLLGREVEGIAPDILALCDHVVEIPMRGTKESFNVSVACGIALYALTIAPQP